MTINSTNTNPYLQRTYSFVKRFQRIVVVNLCGNTLGAAGFRTSDLKTMSGENGVVALLENGDSKKSSSYAVKVGLAQMLRGRVILNVGSVQEARIAEEAGAIAVMAVESIGQRAGVNRMSDPVLIREIKKSVNIPVISRVRIGHFVEGQILEVIGVDFIDESEVLTLADDGNFINKHNFRSPYVCGCRTLGEGLRRIAEGVAMLRTEENANRTGVVVEAVRNVRSVLGDVRRLFPERGCGRGFEVLSENVERDVVS